MPGRGFITAALTFVLPGMNEEHLSKMGMNKDKAPVNALPWSGGESGLRGVHNTSVQLSCRAWGLALTGVCTACWLGCHGMLLAVISSLKQLSDGVSVAAAAPQLKEMIRKVYGTAKAAGAGYLFDSPSESCIFVHLLS